MKTTMALITVLMASTVTLAHGLTAGHATGHGHWKSDKANGQYQMTTLIAEKTIQTSYVLADGSTKEWNFDMVESTNGLFDVMSQGVKLGSGYCLDKAPACHYEISVGPMKLEETLVQEGSKLYRYGSKNQGDGLIVWQESLDQDTNLSVKSKE